MKAVILAGGKGTRLKPFTTVFPKPLMPVGEKPILEIILRQLQSHGFTDVTLAVGYLAELIMTFFGDGRSLDLTIAYSKEEKPLGTAGCLGPIKGSLKDTFLMMNGDILTTLNFSHLYAYHKQHQGIATIALKKRHVKIDFGVVHIDDTMNIDRYTEKPQLDYLVSMGVYIFEPRILEYLQTDEVIDFPDLINRLLTRGEKVKGYVYDGYWLDIGRTDDYEKANAEIETILPSLIK